MKIFSIVLFFCCAVCFQSESAELLNETQKDALACLSVNQSLLRTFSFAKYRICSVQQQGKFYIDTTKDTIKGCLAKGLPWEYPTDKVIFQYTKPGTIALDIGAHIGTHTLALSKAVGKDGVVIAFEPQSKIFRELCMNVKLNECSNVIPVHCALGEKNGQIGLLTPVAINEGGTYVNGAEGELVCLRKLDDFGLKNISFIKMDVENYEDMVLEGAFKTLMASRPVLFLEIQGNNEQLQAAGGSREAKTKSTIDRLKKMGYTVSKFAGCDYLAIP